MNPFKICTSCKELKPLVDFHLQRSRKTGHQCHCKECFKTRYKNKTPEKTRANHIKKYGISWPEYIHILESQDYKCAICNDDIKAVSTIFIKDGAHVDHCHSTNKVRGLLCHSCNAGLGYFKDRIDIIENAKRYLEFYR